MTLDQRLARAVHHVADGVVVPEPDADAVRVRVRKNRRQTAVGVTLAAIVPLLIAGTSVLTGRESSSPVPPAGPVSPSVSESPPSRSQPPLKTRSWETYESITYDFTIGRPQNWTEEPATRKWTWELDIRDHLSPSHVAFLSRNGHVRVSAWNAPLEPSTREESTAYLVEWIEDYCEQSGNSPCTGIAERAVELCLEKWDCHPGLLVPFEHDVQAFFSGGIYAQDAMTVVAVWRPESSRYVAPYGGSQRLLEAFLSTMEVWPSRLPMSERR